MHNYVKMITLKENKVMKNGKYAQIYKVNYVPKDVYKKAQEEVALKIDEANKNNKENNISSQKEPPKKTQKIT